MGLENPSIPNGSHVAVITKILPNNMVHFDVEGYGMTSGRVMSLTDDRLSWIQVGLECNVVVLDGIVSTIENPNA